MLLQWFCVDLTKTKKIFRNISEEREKTFKCFFTKRREGEYGKTDRKYVWKTSKSFHQNIEVFSRVRRSVFLKPGRLFLRTGFNLTCTQNLTFPTRRSRKTFHVETGRLEHPANNTFGTISCEDTGRPE